MESQPFAASEALGQVVGVPERFRKEEHGRVDQPVLCSIRRKFNVLLRVEVRNHVALHKVLSKTPSQHYRPCTLTDDLYHGRARPARSHW